MSLRSRYRLMRMRSRLGRRLGNSRAPRPLLMASLMVAAVFVMVIGLGIVIVLVLIGVVFIAALYVRSFLSRLVPGRHRGATRDDESDTGVTIEGEYTVQDKKPDTHHREP